jgi:glutamate dehydrogenase/leucine dehydrogenase
MNTDWKFADDLGPEKIIYIHRASVGLKAILVVDNVARGPSIGGARMAPDVSVEECFRLARSMTMKNAAAGLPHGGGKSVIFADPKMDLADKERLVRAFARAIGDVRDYIVGPDMGTDERCMAWAYDEIGRAVGLPSEIGGIPLDEIGATGFGVSICAEVAQRYCDLQLEGARIAVQGFGSVGKHAARFLAGKGALLVAASDSRGAVADPDGLDVANLIGHKNETGALRGYGPTQEIERDSLLDVDCDIWIPAARPDVITADNLHRLKAKLVVPGANIGVTLQAEAILAKQGVLVIPDFIANAGGVICAAVEHHGGTESTAFATIEEKIRENTVQVLEDAKSRGVAPREAAVAMAESRVRRAMDVRRWH